MSEEETAQTLLLEISNVLKNRSPWDQTQVNIIKRKAGVRPRSTKKPYSGAPNPIDPVIDDVVRSKTDMEVSMALNAPRLAHALPLAEIDDKLRVGLETGFDSFLRSFLGIRAKIDVAMSQKNARGLVHVKQTRRYDRHLKSVIPDINVVDPIDIIEPDDSKLDVEPPWVVHILRMSKSEFRSRARRGKWRYANQVMKTSSKGHSDDDDAPTNYDAAVRQATRMNEAHSTGDQIILWEIYSIYEKDDPVGPKMILTDVKNGQKIKTLVSPKASGDGGAGVIIHQIRWKESDEFVEFDTPQEQEKELEEAIEKNREPREGKMVEGEERPWPIVPIPYEYESMNYRLSRGAGHLCMDDQINASAVMRALQIGVDYMASPITRGNRPSNMGNVTLRPGTHIGEAEFAKVPDLSSTFGFIANDRRARSARRMGATGQYNYSTDDGSRKLQKTATEVNSDNASGGVLSSASVDRFNTGMSQVYQLIYEDMRRLQLKFPVFMGSRYVGAFSEELYKTPVMMVSAASSKTLSPEAQLRQAMGLGSWMLSFKDSAVINFDRMLKTVLSYYDGRITAGWLPDEDEQSQMTEMIKQVQDDIQSMAKGTKELAANLQEGISSVANLATENGDRIDEISQAS